MRLTFLGTGTSTGVPEVNCHCEICSSTDKRDRRLRCSSILETDSGNTLLLDCSPDFRYQLLKHPFDHIDGVLLTHEHYDHVGGIDDLRPFCRDKALDIYAEDYVCKRLENRLPYCFGASKYPGVPNIHLNSITLDPFHINQDLIIPIRVIHGRLPILGYRIGNMAYLTDLSDLPEEEYNKLKGIDILIISALRHRPHIAHQSLPEALERSRRIAPRKATYLIHFSHALGKHSMVQQELPPGTFLSYDGLKIDF